MSRPSHYRQSNLLFVPSSNKIYCSFERDFKQTDQKMKVEVQSRKFIAPSTPTPNHLRDFKISSMDQINGYYVAFILYYLPEASENGLETCDTRSKQLQKSLAETLALFYPFAGRYNPEKFMIECNDNGAEYIEAKVSEKHLCEVVSGEVEIEELDQLIPLKFGLDKTASGDEFFYVNMLESTTSPLVAVQANMFDCGGLAIGVCISHRIADGFTMARFVDRWARVSRDGIDQVDIPKFLLPALFPARDSFEAVISGSLKKGIATKRVVFDGARIAGLKKELTTTRVKLVTALIWKALIRLNQAKRGCLRRSRIANTMNLRGNVKLPVEDSCGNLVDFFTAEYVPVDHGNKVEFVDLVGLLDDALSKKIRDCAELESEDLFLNTINALKDTREEFFKGEADVVQCSSWCRFPLYEADFGWGTPIWVSFVSAPAEMIIFLMDSRDGDGIEAWVTLEKNDMVLFLQDPDIVSFTANTTT